MEGDSFIVKLIFRTLVGGFVTLVLYGIVQGLVGNTVANLLN